MEVSFQPYCVQLIQDEDGQTTDAPPTEEKVDGTAKKTEEKQEPKTDETKKNDTDKDKTEKIVIS